VSYCVDKTVWSTRARAQVVLGRRDYSAALLRTDRNRSSTNQRPAATAAAECHVHAFRNYDGLEEEEVVCDSL
jgi:hypothetical protein